MHGRAMRSMSEDGHEKVVSEASRACDLKPPHPRIARLGPSAKLNVILHQLGLDGHE